MLSRSIINTVKKSICNNARTLYWTGDRLQSNLFTYNNIRQYIIPKDCNKMDVTKRFKSKKVTDNIMKLFFTHIHIYFCLFIYFYNYLMLIDISFETS